MALNLGIVGLPNVGKSTLFNALTKTQNAQSANYPFCTIEPNKAIVPVPDSRLDVLASLVSPQQVLHAVVEFVDIAGLVRGASKGEGLGNQFLANIRECSAIVHVVRCFDSDNIIHVDSTVNPIRDIETIELELLLSDIQVMTKRIERTQKSLKASKDAKIELEQYQYVMESLENGVMAKDIVARSPEMKEVIDSLCLLTAKPVIYCMNVDEDSLSAKNEYCMQVEEYAYSHNSSAVMLCATLESELQNLEDDEAHAIADSFGIAMGSLEQIVRTGYDVLGLWSYFTVGEKEVRAWTIPQYCKAPDAAAVIHTDFKKGFIRAEVIAYDDFIQYKSVSACRTAGVLRTEGKEYEVLDGDIMHFLFNV